MGLFGKKKKKDAEVIVPTIITKGEEALADPSIILVDSRSYREYCESHIPGSINFPYDKFNKNPDIVYEVFPDKDAKIYLYSLNGDWSWSSELLMKDLGYKNAEHIGTLNAWMGEFEEGDPNAPDTIDEPDQPTE
ncbi:MAG: rhodanese-like domain-containing protein [Coriobacteriales bacterium]|jgi:rhodanese-related sulfurtransferase